MALNRLKQAMETKRWEKINTMYFSKCEFDISSNNAMASFGVDMKHYESSKDDERDLRFITKYNVSQENINKLQKQNFIIPIEPNECITLIFMRTDEYTLILNSMYLYSTQEQDLTNRMVKCSRLSKTLREITSIKDDIYTNVSIIYGIKLVLTKDLKYKETNIKLIKYYHVKPIVSVIHCDFDDELQIDIQGKTKKVKKTNHKKTKTKKILVQMKEPEISIVDIPKTRQEYISRKLIKNSIERITIDVNNIYDIEIYTARVYVLWGYCKISYNMRHFFDQEEMMEIIILLDKLYYNNKRFKNQIQYYQNICITHSRHHDVDVNDSLHITGFLVCNDGIRTNTLHMYIQNDNITSITFIQSKIEQLI